MYIQFVNIKQELRKKLTFKAFWSIIIQHHIYGDNFLLQNHIEMYLIPLDSSLEGAEFYIYQNLYVMPNGL